jgi:hypothetical protein
VSFRAADGVAAEPPAEIVLVLDTMNTSFQQMAMVRQGVEKFLRTTAAISRCRSRRSFSPKPV